MLRGPNLPRLRKGKGDNRSGGYHPKARERITGLEGLTMNALLMAWETTVEDVETVLANVGEDIALAPEYFTQLDCIAIAKAAWDSGVDMAEQTEGAYAEIKRQIKDFTPRGVW